MTKEKRDLLLHYDEDRRVIVFYSVPTAATSDLRAAAFDGVQPDLDYFKSLPPEEAERTLGGLAFSLIDLNCGKKIGIRDYAAEASAAHIGYVQDLERQVRDGDSEAQYHLFIELHSSAMKHYSSNHLTRAEALLLAAVAQGNEEAQRTLADWPLMKAAAERRIKRGKPV
jgi:hypothetical protein